jgi:hypothetical protein
MRIRKEGKYLWIDGKKIKINSIVGFNTASLKSYSSAALTEIQLLYKQLDEDDDFRVQIYYKNWLGMVSKIEMNFWKKEGMISYYDKISHYLAMEGIY